VRPLLPDERLLEAYRAGDGKSLEVLVLRYAQPLYQFLYLYTFDRDETDDLIQDIWVKVWKHAERFDSSRSFKPWLFTIAKRTALDWIKKKKPAVFSEFDTEDGENMIENALVDEEPLPDAIFIREEDAGHVVRALNDLSPKYREVVGLYYQQGFSFEEIAEVLGRPINTVRSQYRRGMLVLKKALGHLAQK
jgi:RNA polymerase sigma-70 factor, ECF subfamily